MGESHLRVNGTDIGVSGRGINVLEIDRAGNKIRTSNFDVYDTDSESDALISWIESVQGGHIILFAADDHAGNVTDNAVTVIESLGSEEIQSVQDGGRNNWAFICVKGLGTLSETFAPSGEGPVTTSHTIPEDMSLTQEGTLEGHVSEVGPAPESLVGWWDMQNSGGIVEDKSGEGNHAEIRGSPTFTGSVVGNTVDLVESNGDYLPIQNLFYDKVEQIPKITMAAWVKTTNNNDYIMQFDRSEFFRCTTGVWVTNSDASGGINDFNYSGASDGNWHHVVHWYDKDASGDKKRVYIDGNLQASTADPHNGTALGSGLDTYGAIGAFGESRSFNGDDSARMTGSMADVRLYETALTPEQIETLYKLTDPRSDQQVMQSDDGVVYTKGGVDERL